MNFLEGEKPSKISQAVSKIVQILSGSSPEENKPYVGQAIIEPSRIDLKLPNRRRRIHSRVVSIDLSLTGEGLQDNSGIVDPEALLKDINRLAEEGISAKRFTRESRRNFS